MPSLLIMISRIQSSCKNGVKFEDAMSQALTEILQNLQVTNGDTKKPICRKASVPTIWYATVGATEERATTFKQSRKVIERRFSEVTTSDLSTMPSLQPLEEEKLSTEQIDIGLAGQDKVLEEVSAEKQKEEADIQPRGLISAPVGGTSETTTLEQPKEEMEGKMSVFTAPALTSMPSLPPLGEGEVNIDKVDISCKEKVIQEVSAERHNLENEDIQPKGLISSPVRATSEMTFLMQPKKRMGRKFSVFTAPALSAAPSLQSLDEEKVSVDEADVGLDKNNNVAQKVKADKQREGVDLQLRRWISAPVIGTSEITLEQPKKEMTSTAQFLSAMPSLESLNEEVSIDKVSIGLGFQDKGIEEGGAEKQREHEDIQPRRRKISAPVMGSSDTRIKQLKKNIKRKFSVFVGPALSAAPSLQSLNEEKVDMNRADISLEYQENVIQEVSAEKQREGADIQRRRRTSAPTFGTSETKTPKQPKKKMRRKFSLFSSTSLQSLDEENVNIDEVDIGFGYNKAINKDTKKQLRRRRVSAPARTYREAAETTPFKQPKNDLVRKMSRPKFLPDVALPAMPWLADCVEEQMEADFEPVEFNLSFLDDLMKSV